MIEERYSSICSSKKTLEKYLYASETGTAGHFFNYPPIGLKKIELDEKTIIERKIKEHGDCLKSIYIHWPFCILPDGKEKCDFCCSYTANERENKKIRSNYFNALLKEIEQFTERKHFPPAENLYFGGGTPLEMQSAELDMIFQKLEECGLVGKSTFISIESRPELIIGEKLEVLVKHSISRVSLGVESLDNEIACIMGRISQGMNYCEIVYRAISLLKEYKINSINIDLILGHPNESEKQFLGSLNKVIAFDVDSIAVYPLGMPSALTLLEKRIKCADDIKSLDYRARMALQVSEIMKKAGYAQVHDCIWSKKDVDTYRYDTSSNCVANCWNQTSILPIGLSVGFGVSAISGIENILIIQNTFNLTDYITNVEKKESSIESAFWLSKDESCRLQIVSGILHRVIDKKRFIDLFGEPPEKLFSKEFTILQEYDLLEEIGETYRVTSKGIRYIQAIARFFFSRVVEQRYREQEEKRADYKLYKVNFRGLE